MNPRPDVVRLDDINYAITKIIDFKDSFYLYERDEYLRTVFFDAILYNLVIIGEAVRNLSHATRSKISFEKWNEVVGLRNHLVHKYGSVDREMILAILNEGLFELKEALE